MLAGAAGVFLAFVDDENISFMLGVALYNALNFSLISFASRSRSSSGCGGLGG